jgi:GNAT superfamily N-acetyltransferase
MSKEFPLTRVNRLLLARAYRNVPRMDISIECVIEGQMGKAYVDDLDAPTAFQIKTGPFLYFAGDPSSEGGQQMLKSIPPWTFFMPSADGWLEAGRRMYGDKLTGFDRYSFSANCLSPAYLQTLLLASKYSTALKQMDLALASRVWAQDHFVDLSEFESPSDFIARGIGYYVERSGKILGAAYSSLVCSRAIEISLFVLEDYRRKGMATTLAAHLLHWCLENSMEPHWDAANLESCRLAEKLGYIPQGKYQAYYLDA